MDRITDRRGPGSHPTSSGKITTLKYEIAVGLRCAKCKKKTEKCECQSPSQP